MQRSDVSPDVAIVEGQEKRARSPTIDEQMLEAVEQHERLAARKARMSAAQASADARLARAQRAFEEAKQDAQLMAERTAIADAEPQDPELRRLHHKLEDTEEMYRVMAGRLAKTEHLLEFSVRAVEHVLAWKKCIIQAQLPSMPPGPRTPRFVGHWRADQEAATFRRGGYPTPVRQQRVRRTGATAGGSGSGSGSGAAASASTPSPRRARDVYGKK